LSLPTFDRERRDLQKRPICVKRALQKSPIYVGKDLQKRLSKDPLIGKGTYEEGSQGRF